LALTKLGSSELSYRLKAGPMGPSILSSHLCAIALLMKEEYLSYFESICENTGSPQLLKLFEHSIDLCTSSDSNRVKPITGRISLASEPGGKTRLFAICNF
jgi:hypothetical protein